MKYAKIENGEIKISQCERPALNGEGAIIKVYGTGLCGSDIVKFLHKNDSAILGHEITGEIVEINSKTDFKKGDFVMLGHHYPCMNCEFCKNESYSMCETFKKTNIVPCGFAEYIYVSEGHLKNTVFKMPSNLTADEASFLEPLACCIRACNRAQIKEGNRALVVGLGSIGLLMAQALKQFGAKVYGYDINQDRQTFSHLEFDEKLKYNIIFMTSGSSRALETALKYVQDGGKIIVFSSIKNDEGYTNNDIYYRELSIIGSYSPSPCDYKTSFEFLKDKKVDVKNYSTKYSLDNLSCAIDDTVKGKILKAFIKL